MLSEVLPGRAAAEALRAGRRRRSASSARRHTRRGEDAARALRERDLNICVWMISDEDAMHGFAWRARIARIRYRLEADILCGKNGHPEEQRCALAR